MNSVALDNIFAFIVILWTIFWKGIALWRAAHLNQRNWFVVMLVLNTITFGILEIIYLFWFAKKRLTLEEMRTWKNFFTTREPEKK